MSCKSTSGDFFTPDPFPTPLPMQPRHLEQRDHKDAAAVRDDTWAALESLFALHPFLQGGPVAHQEIDAASVALHVAFPDDYRDFLLRHGGAIVGPHPVFGLRPVEPMGNEWSVVAVNRRYREDQWPGLDDWLIVSTDHAGNPIGIGADQRVWVSDHDVADILPIANSFEHFIRRDCLGMPWLS